MTKTNRYDLSLFFPSLAMIFSDFKRLQCILYCLKKLTRLKNFKALAFVYWNSFITKCNQKITFGKKLVVAKLVVEAKEIYAFDQKISSPLHYDH